MTAEDRVPVVADAWRELEAIALAMRPDWREQWPLWHPDSVRSALLAAHAAMPFERAATELWRLIWAADGTPAELRNTARATRPQPATGPEVRARGLAAVRAAAGIDTEARQEAGIVTTHPSDTNERNQ